MSESTEPPNPSTAVDRPGLPPLRLHHLLAMTAVSAVMMTLFRPTIPSGSDSEAMRQLWIGMAIWGTLYALLLTFAITVVAFGIAWRLKGIPVPNQPGHWLLIAIVATYLFETLLLMSLATLASFSWWMLFLRNLPGAVLDIYIGLKQCAERRWRWVFYLKAVANFLPVLGDFALMIMLSRANLWDRREGIRRDMLHRSGVAVQLALCVLMVSMVIFFVVSFALRLW